MKAKEAISPVAGELGEPVSGHSGPCSMLESMQRMIALRDDCSLVTVECAPADYSASHLAHAVEDADVHLVDLLSTPRDHGLINVTLRVRCSDPTPVVHNLERYGYDVTDVCAGNYVESTVTIERLLGLKALMDV